MGSGKNRKKTDTTIIRTPKQYLGTGFGSFRPTKSDTVAEVCLASFDVKISPSPYTKEKLQVSLTKVGDTFLITAGIVELGNLNKRQASMVSRCLELGVKYRGSIIKNKEEWYARFFRILQ